MLPSLSMTADRLPISGTGYEDIPVESSRLSGFFASGRMGFRTSNPVHGVVVEAATAQRARETVEADPALSAAYEAAPRKRRLQIRPGYNPPVRPRYESILPTYTPAEMAEMGYAVNSGIDFGPAGRLTIPRYSILAAARTEQDIDAATVAAMPEGVLSGAAALTGALAYGLGDPVNLIPFGAGVNVAKQAAKAGKAVAIAKGAGAGIISAAPGVALSDAIAFPQANKWGEDLGIKDALIDIIAGSALGAFFGGIGAAARLHSRKIGAALQEGTVEATGKLEKGEMPDSSGAMARVADDVDTSIREQAHMNARDREYFRADRDGAVKSIESLKKALEGPRRETTGATIITGDAPTVFNALDNTNYKIGFGSAAQAEMIRAKLAKEIGADVAELPPALAEPLAVYQTSNETRAAVVSMKSTDGMTEALVVVRLERQDAGKTLAIVDADHLRSPAQLPPSGEMRYFAAARRDDLARQGEAGAALMRDGDSAAEGLVTDEELITWAIADDVDGTAAGSLAVRRERGINTLKERLGEDAAELDEALRAVERQAELDAETAPAPREVEAEVDLDLAALEARLREENLTPEQLDYLENGKGPDLPGRRADQESINYAEAQFTATECLVQSFSGFVG